MIMASSSTPAMAYVAIKSRVELCGVSDTVFVPLGLLLVIERCN